MIIIIYERIIFNFTISYEQAKENRGRKQKSKI